ncbi:MAG: apolipoprotein N-acyltransferase [Candidatus Omnitrophica bacterium]|nr:apolipoprotein N-acyltransferase [Candidatus Omnitrophota bacterium]
MRFPKFKKLYLTAVLILLTALLLVLSFPPVNSEFFSWLAFVFLFFALRNKSKTKAFFTAYVCGIIFWIGNIYWLANVTILGLILLVAYLAIYFAIFGLVINRYSLLSTRYSIFAVPSLWVLLEYLRSHLLTGFGWGLLGYSQYLNLPIIQIADITGIWGVSFLVMMVNVTFYRVMGFGLRVTQRTIKGKNLLLSVTLPALLLLLSLGYGFYKLSRTPDPGSRIPIRISVIQGNIPQVIKWQEYAKEQILGQYLFFSQRALLDNPDLVIWPEAALPGIPYYDPDIIGKAEGFFGDSGVPLLTGVVNQDNNIYYNSAVLISGAKSPMQRYDKLHLVPFGEYIPFREVLTFLETVVPIGDFQAGKEYTIFSCPISEGVMRFSVLICFEDIFPQISRQFVKRGADFLVNITNDAWFGDTSSPYQHSAASVFRAVENGVYLVRSANTGVSGFISPSGELYPLAKEESGRQTFISGHKSKDVFLKKNSPTLYVRLGDWFILTCWIIVICGICKVKKREKLDA